MTEKKADARPTTLFSALIAARKEMPDPRKSAENGAFKSASGKKSKYVPRDEALDAIVPTALQFGIMVAQAPVSDDKGYGVHSIVYHESGETIDFGTFTVKPSKDDPQGAVAATTYSSRCALMLIFGLAGDEDDDGNKISKPKEPMAGEPFKQKLNELLSKGVDKATVIEAIKTHARTNDLEKVTLAQGVTIIAELEQKFGATNE